MNPIFNNCDPYSNGEKWIIDKIPRDSVIFDVGCRNESLFLKHPAEVHYFDPNPLHYIEICNSEICLNNKSVFNNFGLSDENAEILYYPKFESFVNRVISLGVDDTLNAIPFKVKTGLEYMREKSIEKLDFWKLDTERM